MKRLLYAALFLVAAMQAQPVAQNTTLKQQEYNAQSNIKLLRGELMPLVSGGTPPYQFEKEEPVKNTTLQIVPRGEYAGTFAAQPSPRNFEGQAQFNYRVSDSTGQVSNIATVTIIFGQEKG